MPLRPVAARTSLRAASTASVPAGPQNCTRARSARPGGRVRNSSVMKASLTGVARSSTCRGARRSRGPCGWPPGRRGGCGRGPAPRRRRGSPGSGGRPRPRWSAHAPAPARSAGLGRRYARRTRAPTGAAESPRARPEFPGGCCRPPTRSRPRLAVLPLSRGELLVGDGRRQRSPTATNRRRPPGYGLRQDPCRDVTVAVPSDVPYGERIVCGPVPGRPGTGPDSERVGRRYRAEAPSSVTYRESHHHAIHTAVVHRSPRKGCAPPNLPRAGGRHPRLARWR